MINKKVYQGKIFSIYHKSLKDKNGNIHLVEKCSRDDVVTVLGLNNDNELLLIKEFRSGAGKKILWLPGGKVEKSEKPESAARREFAEETGYCSDDYTLFHKKSPSDTFIGNGYVYLAKNIYHCSKKQFGDETGKINIVFVSLDKAMDLAIKGKIANEFFAFIIIKLYYMICKMR